MRVKYLPILAICMMTTGCNSSKQQAALTSGIDLANLDTMALPGTDFYKPETSLSFFLSARNQETGNGSTCITKDAKTRKNPVY